MWLSRWRCSTVSCLHDEGISAFASRLLGWTLTLIAVTTLVSMAIRNWTPGPMFGPGGMLGMLWETWLTSNFGRIGGFLLAGSMLIAGVLLWTDYVLVRLGIIVAMFVLNMMTAIRAPRGGLSRVGGLARLGHSKNGKTHRFDSEEVDEGDTEDDKEASSMPIKIGGRKIDLRTDLDQAEEDEYEAEEDEYEEEGAAEEDEYETEEDEELEAEPAGAAAASSLVAKPSKPRFKPHKTSQDKTPEEEREAVIEQLEEASVLEEAGDYELPPVTTLMESEEFSYEAQETEVRRKAKILEKTFRDFNLEVRVVEIETGPVIAQYEVQLAAGLKLSKITGLADDLAIALKVPSVRIVAPIPGKNTVGIEVPNAERQLVRLREVMDETNGRVKKMRIPAVPRKGCFRKSADGRPVNVASLAYRWSNGNGEKCLPECNYRIHPDDSAARRSAYAYDRSQDGRA